MWLTSQLRLLAISDDMNRMEIGASLSFILKILVVTILLDIFASWSLQD